MKKTFLAFLTIVAIVLALNSGGLVHTPKAEAQSVSGLPFANSSSGSGSNNPYDGRGEMFQTWTGTLSTTAVGVICTTVTGTRVSIKAMSITCATAQYVDIYDSATQVNVGGSAVLAHIYCISNVPTVLTRDLLGTGITGSLSTSMGILGGNTGACYILYSVQRPTN